MFITPHALYRLRHRIYKKQDLRYWDVKAIGEMFSEYYKFIKLQGSREIRQICYDDMVMQGFVDAERNTLITIIKPKYINTTTDYRRVYD